MAFNFGGTNQTPLFGSTAAKSTPFGTPAAPGGTQLPSFGQTTLQPKPVGIAAPSFSQPSAFGTSTSFAAPATQQPSAFGGPTTNLSFGAFGATTQQQQPFGSTVQQQQQPFGTPAQQQQQPFGSIAQQPQFGLGGAFGSAVPVPKTQATGGLFGAPSTAGQFSFPGTATSKPGGLFGSAVTSQGTGLFGSTAPSGGLFGSTSTAGFGTGLFGSTAPTTTTSSLFGTAGTSGGGLFGTTGATSLFGAPATSTAPLFGTGSFGAPKPAFGTGTFGTTGGAFGTTGGGLFGQQQQPLFQLQQQQQQQQIPVDTQELRNRQVLSSLHAVNIFSDERDEILKKWNHLQASWGTGKGYFNPQHPPVEYNDYNPLYAFRGFGYFMMPATDNSEGLVKMIFNKKETELKTQREVLSNGMAGILGNKPNLTVNIKSIKGISETDTEVTITVSEKSVTGVNRTILATELSAYLNQPAQRLQLQGVGVSMVTPCVIPSKAQIQEYLRMPPAGIGPHTWAAAQSDNPQPSKFLPMPMNGFTQLKKRMITEDQETALHRSFLESVNGQITDLQRKHTATMSQITEQKQKYLQLQHRVLQILVKQEVTRKVGMTLQPEEEVLRGRLEMMYAHLNLPTQFRGQIQELLASVQIRKKFFTPKNETTYKMDPNVQEDIKQFLKMQQNGIAHLVDIINNDLKDLKTIFEGMNEIIKK